MTGAEDWTAFNKFAGYLDLAAFTTYPELLHTDPSQMPDTYYSELSTKGSFTIPVAFTEVGWSSSDAAQEVEQALLRVYPSSRARPKVRVDHQRSPRPHGHGIVVAAQGRLILDESQVLSNTATAAAAVGAGIWNSGGTVVITGGLVSGMDRILTARMQSRIVMSPLGAKLFHRALTENLGKFEAAYGEIIVPRGSTLADQLFHPPQPPEKPMGR